ncbi:nucleolin [Salix suchowensis]|nr:nucleolin [Salix suchowensis]
MEGAVCSNSVSLKSFLSSFMEAVVLETAIAASKALALSLHMIGSVSDGSSVLPEASGTSPGFPLTELLPKKKSDPDNQDGSDTEDDQDDEDEDGQDDQDDDEGDEDEPGKDNEDSEDPEDEPEANGDGGSDDDDETTTTTMMRKMKKMMMRRRRRRRRKIFPSHHIRRGNENKIIFLFFVFCFTFSC